MRRFVAWLCDFRPVFLRTVRKQNRFLADLHDREVREIGRRHGDAIVECKAKVGRVLEKLGEIRWERGGPYKCYRMTLSFSPDIMGRGYLDRGEMELVADYFGRKVANEIVTSKFVEDAYKNALQPSFRYF